MHVSHYYFKDSILSSEGARREKPHQKHEIAALIEYMICTPPQVYDRPYCTSLAHIRLQEAGNQLYHPRKRPWQQARHGSRRQCYVFERRVRAGGGGGGGRLRASSTHSEGCESFTEVANIHAAKLRPSSKIDQSTVPVEKARSKLR